MEKKKATIVEIGPRDGFQSIKEFIPTEVKLEIVDGLVKAGYKKIQVTSFMSEKAIPQMKDSKIVSAKAMELYPDTEFFALVPNLYGARSAAEVGLKEIACVVSLSESHNKANINRTHEQSLDEMKKIRESFPDIWINQDIATAFGCPFEGEMSVQALVDLLGRYIELGVKEFTLCDTIGVAHPAQVEKVFAAVKAAFPDILFNGHIHDTRNMGVINSYTALKSGANAIQTAVGGLGGCPFAPGASGNTASEDFVYMLEKEGYDTGINFDVLLQTARLCKEKIDGNFSGHHINITAKQCGYTSM